MEGMHHGGGRKEEAEGRDDDKATRRRHDFVSLSELVLVDAARFVVPVFLCLE